MEDALGDNRISMGGSMSGEEMRPELRAAKIVTQAEAGDGSPTRFLNFEGVRCLVEAEDVLDASEVVRELRFTIAGEIHDAIAAEKARGDDLEKSLAAAQQSNAALRLDLARLESLAEAETTIASLRLELQLERAKVQSLTSIHDEMVKGMKG